MTDVPGDDAAGPAYAGAADQGLRSSVAPDHPMLGDAASVLGAEFSKLDNLYGDVVALLDAGQVDEAGRRWFGVVRETLEFEAACGRVVVPAVAATVQRRADADPATVIELLRPHDELNPSSGPDRVRATVTRTVELLKTQQEVLLPAVQALGRTERDRLGEDLRQVMG